MSIKEAFDTYFEKMNDSWYQKYKTHPKIVNTKRYENCGLFISEKDNHGYREWQPKIQTETVDFKFIEANLGFEIHPQIKEFLSTYWFFQLRGSISNTQEFQINEILPQIDMFKLIKQRFKKEQYHYLNEGEFFLIGTYCCLNKDDSYLVQVNNDTCEVTAVQVFDKISVKLADSIEDLLKNMNVEWG